MQIGVMNHPARDPIREIDWIGQNGFDFVDFTLEPPAADPEEIDVDAIRAALVRHNLGVVSHTAYYLPLASPFASIRQACLSEFRKALKAAHRIGATVLNTHFDKPPKFFTDRQTIEWHSEVLGPLCDEAVEVGVTIVLEQVPFAGGNQMEIICDILESVSLLRFHLDSGHAKLEKGHDRWNEYIDRLGSKLAHVHLSDNDGTADQHLPLGSAPRSTTDWPKHVAKLKTSGYDGTITLEVFSPEKEHLLVSRDLLRRWWEGAQPFLSCPLQAVHVHVENVVRKSLRHGGRLMGKRKRQLPALVKFEVGDTEVRKKSPMRLHEWEATIQEMVDECTHAEKREGKVLLEWRAKLEKESSHLRPFQIDEIVREVRRRLNKVSR